MNTALRKIALESRDRFRNAIRRLQVAVGQMRGCQIVICGEADSIARSQTHPILEWADGLQVGWVDRRHAAGGGLWRSVQPEFVFLQSRWDTPFDELARLVNTIRNESPKTRLCYLDWFAPAHFHEPRIIDLVDLYVKKHLLRDRGRYLGGMCETNLVEYEAQWDPAFLKPRQGSLRADQLDKVMIGWGFAVDPKMLDLLRSGCNGNGDRAVDFNCRIYAPQGARWYDHMRRRCLAAAAELKSNRPAENILATTEFLGKEAYAKELARSKTCFSPFGFGEVCWRDYEAIAAGCALLKQDMSHLEVAPDLYRNGETYIGLQWDLGDLVQKYEFAIDPATRRSLTRAAVACWEDFAVSGWRRVWEDLLQQLHGGCRGARPTPARAC